MSGVIIQNIDKSFGDVTVLENISAEVNDGEFMVLVGPSGCGKSTLLRMIAGLEPITSGTIAIGGNVVNDLPPKERDIAMVFQNYALFPHLSVADNMAFSMMLAKAPKAQRLAKVQEAARILDLTDLLERKPRQLSGGQRQRVAMGRALVRNPQVFLFDEPLSNLDAKLRVAMRAEIRALHQRLGTTAIYVTHDQVEAMTMADRIVVLNDGHIQQLGSPLDLYDDPKNLFVAGFIGSPAMNLLQGKVVVEHGKLAVQFDNDWSFQAPAVGDLKVGETVTYGIRPEHGSLDDNGVVFEVGVVEQMGSETHLILNRGERSVTVSIRERSQIKPGDMLSVLADPSHALLFDCESGMRIDYG